MSKVDQIKETASIQEQDMKDENYGMKELTEDMGNMLSESEQKTQDAAS